MRQRTTDLSTNQLFSFVTDILVDNWLIAQVIIIPQRRHDIYRHYQYPFRAPFLVSTPGVLALEALEVTNCVFDITVLIFFFFVFRCRLNWEKSNDVCHEYTGFLLLLPLIEKK